ncbi:hypothetical protein KIW84_050423 [Lathyrus oleraceus]|uniref:Uncharacterized protein n=1 Tax=Pisum sativum TaxID=3888 RepID=A0A9D5AEK6_PEA|nr:hypothetical protein KIW84_050423 [Pisum sativum]
MQKTITVMYEFSNSGIMVSQQNTIGVIGGVPVLSYRVFSEKLACWSSRNGRQCPPYVVCSDPVLNNEFLLHGSFPSTRNGTDHIKLNQGLMVQNLQHKRNILNQSGARGLALPCHLSHARHSEISQDSSLPFLQCLM